MRHARIRERPGYRFWGTAEASISSPRPGNPPCQRAPNQLLRKAPEHAPVSHGTRAGSDQTNRQPNRLGAYIRISGSYLRPRRRGRRDSISDRCAAAGWGLIGPRPLQESWGLGRSVICPEQTRRGPLSILYSTDYSAPVSAGTHISSVTPTCGEGPPSNRMAWWCLLFGSAWFWHQPARLWRDRRRHPAAGNWALSKLCSGRPDDGLEHHHPLSDLSRPQAS